MVGVSVTGSARRVLLALELILPDTGCEGAVGSSGSIVCSSGVATLMVVMGIKVYSVTAVPCPNTIRRVKTRLKRARSTGTNKSPVSTSTSSTYWTFLL